MSVTVSALAIAPVKGMRLTAVSELELGPAGAAGDRAFVVVEAADHELAATARNPALLQVTPVGRGRGPLAPLPGRQGGGGRRGRGGRDGDP